VFLIPSVPPNSSSNDALPYTSQTFFAPRFNHQPNLISRPQTAAGRYPRKEEFAKEWAVFVTAAQIRDGHVFFNECSRLNSSKAKKLRKGWARTGDVLLTHNATVGRVAIVEDVVGPFLLGTSVTHYRTNQSLLLNRFLYWLVCAPVFQDQLNAINRNSGRTESTMQATKERVRRLASRHGHGNRPSGQSSTTTRITATTAKVMATATMVCWLTT
jgi:hypothetical protein